MDLRAVVIGAGFAGEGHTFALRAAGVTVEAICARSSASSETTAKRLGISRASTDWRSTLRELRPDIVSVAVPAGAHPEIVIAALNQGCHVFCDKPLATTAPVARQLYDAAIAANVKHAYAATHRYDPSVVWLEELIGQGTIGCVGEVEATFRRYVGPLIPWSWYDRVDLGGGLLHNALPHWLGILQRVLSGELESVVGETRVIRERAPFVPDIHDIRMRGARAPTEQEAQHLDWRPCDADGGFTALFRFRTNDPSHRVQVSISATGNPAAWPANGFRFHGTGGTLVADGQFSYTVRLHRAGEPAGTWQEMPVPARILAEFPSDGDEFQRKWTCLAKDFVADIRGESHRPYLTFRDGWRFQTAFDTIRSGVGWTAIPF